MVKVYVSMLIKDFANKLIDFPDLYYVFEFQTLCTGLLVTACECLTTGLVACRHTIMPLCKSTQYRFKCS
jgi:hypothetical protein